MCALAAAANEDRAMDGVGDDEEARSDGLALTLDSDLNIVAIDCEL